MKLMKVNSLVVGFFILLSMILATQSSFAKTYYLVRKDGSKVDIDKVLPKYVGEYPIPYGIYIPNVWGGKYKRFNEKYGKIYGRKVLGGYEYSSASILAIMYNGLKVVDEDGKKVEFLPKIIRERLYYAVAEPSKVNDTLWNVIRDYVANDIHGNPSSTYVVGGAGSN